MTFELTLGERLYNALKNGKVKVIESEYVSDFTLIIPKENEYLKKQPTI